MRRMRGRRRRTRGGGIPPEEGEEFVEPDPELRRIAPGSLPVYRRGISMLPVLEDWQRTVGEIVLIAEGDT
jgi:hypothetical protein